MTADYAEAVRKHRFDLLYVEGKLAALIETIPEADHLLIENVAVSPSFQGRSLGRKLMEKQYQRDFHTLCTCGADILNGCYRYPIVPE